MSDTFPQTTSASLPAAIFLYTTQSALLRLT